MHLLIEDGLQKSRTPSDHSETLRDVHDFLVHKLRALDMQASEAAKQKVQSIGKRKGLRCPQPTGKAR